MNKAEAGKLGGESTVKKHGNAYMKELAKRGAAAFHAKYKLMKLNGSDFAIVNRTTGIPTGKTIRGLEL